MYWTNLFCRHIKKQLLRKTEELVSCSLFLSQTINCVHIHFLPYLSPQKLINDLICICIATQNLKIDHSKLQSCL